jgi:hypothetical protein
LRNWMSSGAAFDDGFLPEFFSWVRAQLFV